ASTGSKKVPQVGSSGIRVTISPTGGFTGQVTLSVSGLPSGANASFTPNPATASSTLSVTTSASTPTGTYTLTLTGASGSLTRTTTVTLTVEASGRVTYDSAVSSGFQWGVAGVNTPSFVIRNGTKSAAM